jgi:proteasome lid subunit RPN8/RPN11
VTEFIPVKNVYDEMHAKYPETYSRTAKTAYLIDPKEQRRIFDDVEKNDQEVKGIYHSHTDHDAYFSEEDRLVAAPWGEPMYPGVSYIVVSIWSKKLKAINEFFWDEGKKNFQERKII